MKLDAARAIIQGAPNTHLAEAARTVLGLLDACDTARVEAAEAHLSVQAEALAVAREEAAALDFQVREQTARKQYWVGRYETECARVGDLVVERDRLAKELEEAKKPHPDLERLQALETAAVQLRDAQPPTRAEARWMWQRCVAYLTPYLR